MSTLADAAGGEKNPVARFTAAVFSLAPLWLTMLALRFALALPFWNSGMTKWDGWFTLSFGAQALFADEFKLHIFGAEYPYPAPQFMAYASAIGETTLPVLLVLGLLTRYAALGLLAMTAIIQLTVPDGWVNFHLPWAAMALAILTFGPGRISLDWFFDLDREPAGRLSPAEKAGLAAAGYTQGATENVAK
jgi:putative oxidoreductase